MNYIPLSDDYKSSAIYHMRHGRNNILFVCSNIINSLTSKEDNDLKKWATSSRYNIQHLIRFLRYTDKYQIYLIPNGVECKFGVGCDEIDTSISTDMRRDVNGAGYLLINRKRVTINDSESKDRDPFINQLPLKFESHDFTGKEIWANRLFMAITNEKSGRWFLDNYDTYNTYCALFPDEQRGYSEGSVDLFSDLYFRIGDEIKEFKTLNKQYL